LCWQSQQYTCAFKLSTIFVLSNSALCHYHTLYVLMIVYASYLL
jgi:hypothetical protein